MEKRHQFRNYFAGDVCLFRKTKEKYGGFSNMAANFSITVNDKKILTTEALYQACRFPNKPDLQEEIIRQRSPMSAKMVTKPYRDLTRNDWDEVKVSVMQWCLKIKLAQNFIDFGKLLESTGEKPIVEDSSKDDFWGAKRDKNNPDLLIGVNALGRLLMDLRLKYYENKYSIDTFVIEPLNIVDFKLFGSYIKVIDERYNFVERLINKLRLETDEYLSKQSDYLIKEKSLLLFGTKSENSRSKRNQSKRKKDNRVEKQFSIPF